MRTNPKFSSDGFEVFDDPDFVVTCEDDLDERCIDDAHADLDDRILSARQRIELFLSERQFRSDLDEWTYWDEYLLVH